MIVYASMYGSCEEAARIAADELKKNFKKPIIYQFTDMGQASASQLIGDAADSESTIIIAPTYENEVFPTIGCIINLMLRKIPPKPVLVISSYGWASAAKQISGIFSKAGFPVRGVIDFRGAVSETDAQKIRAGVRALIGNES